MSGSSLYILVLDTLEKNATDTPTKIFLKPYIEARQMALKVMCLMWPPIVVFGLVANVTNIIVFIKAGVQDNVTTLLFSLSLSDLMFLIIISPHLCYWIVASYGPAHAWPFDYRFIRVLVYWPAFTTYDLSAFISVSLGVMRCACMAMPLKFKAVFTKSRTIKWILFLVVLAVSLRIPVLTIFRVGWRTDPVTNASYLVIETHDLMIMSRINDIMNRGFVIWINYITMVACVCILNFKLHEASKIRLATTEGPATEKSQARDFRVVKSVVLVCTIFILSQLPYLFMSLTRLINTDHKLGPQLSYVFAIVSDMAKTCAILNSSLNIFVYFNYNSKYRATLLSLLRSGGKQ